MHEALYYDSKGDGTIQCTLCPRNCNIGVDKLGFCGVRKNVDGKLVSLVYGRVAGDLAVDPIEKKPLFHFLPGSSVLSFGTVGCNLHCKHCQNWNTSQVQAGQFFEKDFSPEEIVKAAKDRGCDSIAYTYNEPTVFFEYMLETAKLAKEAGLKNIMVSNGFINEKPLKEICQYLDSVNIDLKGFTNPFYGRITGGWLEPVLDTLKFLKKEKIWFEITNLVIPTLNDDPELVKKMCSWIKDELGIDIPLHLTAFHPDFELGNVPPTPVATLLNAYEIAKGVGLKFVFVGNIMARGYENTLCPECDALLIERLGFNVLKIDIVNGKCKSCGCKIPGVFK
ncbi:AmmeMemoRadiSam system radical SAM enzyme [archaeon]|nr:AmmeMemoRadiSam system radical SAM enzyme [archaeon]MBL7057404.1 AmmeMemoRadiSam system radical SAM enzyme [Candidatus Woesearchaeota archaeon]